MKLYERLSSDRSMAYLSMPNTLATIDPNTTNENSTKWGPILLVGGAGRLGYFIAQHLLQQPECGRIISISRSNKVPHPYDGVEYRAADLRDPDALKAVFNDIKPETVINAAAPAHANTLTPASEFEEVVVKGQDTLIALSKESGTKYMICTTSANVVQGDSHVMVNETAPTWPEDSPAFAYWIQRARAERILLAADSPQLQTVSLRLPLIIGERDYAFVPALIKSYKDGQTGIQVGNDSGSLATVSAPDAAKAHTLALRALMMPGNNIHGEAFYITGREALPFWTMARIVWSEAGWENKKAPFIMPEWAAWAMARIGETLMWPFGKEPVMSTHVVKFMCNTWTYDGFKAKERLGFVPEDDTEETLRKSVRWQLAHEKAQQLESKTSP